MEAEPTLDQEAGRATVFDDGEAAAAAASTFKVGGVDALSRTLETGHGVPQPCLA